MTNSDVDLIKYAPAAEEGPRQGRSSIPGCQTETKASGQVGEDHHCGARDQGDPPSRACQRPKATVGARPYCWHMDGREAAQRWADVWERGWREQDADAIAGLYAQDAFWQQHPFREPEPGYLGRVFAEEDSAQCKFGTPIVDGDQAAVPWSAQTRLADGGSEDLAGVSMLRFRADGLVVEERDFFVQR